MGAPDATNTWYPTVDGNDTANAWTPTDAGDDAIAVASCRSSSGTADTTAVEINGWTTNADNYIKVWTDPSLGNRHDGRALDSGGNYTGYSMKVTEHWVTMIENTENYTHIEGVIIDGDNYAFSGISASGDTAGIVTYVDSCIAFNSSHSNAVGFMSSGNTILKISNSIAYNLGGYGFYQHSWQPQYYYNCLAVNCNTEGFHFGTAYGNAVVKIQLLMGIPLIFLAQ